LLKREAKSRDKYCYLTKTRYNEAMNEESNNLDVPPSETMAEIVQSEDVLIPESTDPSFTSDAEKLMGQLVNVNSSNIYHEPTCIVCSCSSREKIEEMHLAKSSREEIIKYVKDHSGIELSPSIIDNHMLYHYDKGVREHVKTAYIDRIRRLASQETTTLSRIRMSIDALMERIIGINSIVPCGDLNEADVEKIKSQETARLTRTMTQLLQLQANMMGEMTDSGELITIPKKAFVRFFNEAITDARTDVEREIINNLLASLGELAQM